ncbi:MAG: SDR family NAD(P)-dependent oxidoreductase, partial [Cyanobacteria bacterium P01_G01_bin.19]
KIFQSNCDRCLEILQPYIDLTAAKIFSETPSPCCDINKTQYTQPLLFTVEYSLAQMWLSWGIKPDVMVGHSIGEYVAATIAGVFDLADALKLVAVRGKLIQDLPENGAMLAVFASQERIKDLLPDTVSLAADNGSHLVLSGLKKAIADLAAELESQLIKTQLLKVSHGFHSWLMQPMIEEFAAVAKTIKYSVPKISIISNLTGDLAAENIATPDYWVEHILKPVQFAKSIKYLDRQGIEIFLEIGTKPILTGMTNSILEHKLCLPTLDSKNSDWSSILSTLSQLYNRGVEIDWQMVTKNYDAQKTSLPTYPFQRKRYWFDPPHKSEYIKTSPKDLVHPLLGEHIASPLKQTILQSNLQIDTVAWLQDHHVEDKAIFPGAAYLELAIALAIFKQQELPLAIKDFNIVAPLYINQNSQIQSILDPQKEYLSCEIYSLDNDNWQLHAKGKILSAVEPARKENLEALKLEFEQSELDIKQHYQNCQAKGINYGKSFQGIKELYGKNERALGLIELPTHLDSQAYKFHPALLDACLQIIFAALPQELQSKTYIPVDIEKFTLYRLPDRKVWSYLELISLESDRCIANVWLYDETGELVAKLQGLKSQVIKSKPAWHDWLYQQKWQLQQLATQINLSQNGTWLIFNDRHNRGEQVAAQLTAHNHKCCLITRDDIEDNPLAYIDLVKQHPSLTGIVYLWSLDKTQDWLECQSYLYLVQALIQHPHNPSLWFVTHNAQPVNGDRLTESSISNSCLWGMQKAIALEHPKLNCTGIDLDSPQNLPDILIREIGTQQNEPVAYRNNRRYVSRLVKYNRQTSKKSDRQLNQQLEIKDPGNLDSLQWKPSSRQQPQDNEIQIAVKATGLNFRDVMVALDLYPDKTKFLGLECSGIVTAVGKNVSSFKLGDQVTAISDSSFSQYLNVNSLLAIHQPESLSFEEMATIPVTFLTAYYTLVHLAKLQPGEKILIHAAAGGVGLAAIQIAQNIGAEIYATASTPKWELLKSMGVTKIMNSRNLDFAEEVMPATNNQGVDVVLNSLSGEFIAKSIAVLKDNGRFIEIGKQDIWTKNDVLREKLNIKYHIVDLWLITQEKPELIQQMLGQLSQQFIAKQLKPLPITKFDSNKAIAAFRYMQQGKHQGKIIITPPSQHFEGTYLIAGGMGAIGLRIAQWLIDKGVENLVLIGRNDIKPQYQDLLEKLQEKSHITCIKADISNTEQLKQALKIIKLTLPTLKGIVHCAGVTSDRTIAQQDWNSFAKVLAPKTQGAWNLHDLTQEYDLENFIMFSSAASLIGSSGQANYCAANVFLDALAHLRRSLGLPGISINWGAWRNTGLAADANITASLEQKGINAIEPERGIEILEELLLDNPRQMGVIPINWDTWQKNNTVTNFYENLIDGDRFKTDSTENSTVKQQLLNASYEQKKILLVEQISQQVGNILGTKDINQIDLELGFSELGLDSLSSVELRNKLQSIYNIKLPSTVIFDYFNIKSLANHLLSLLFTSKSLSIEEQTIVEERQLLDIENISETEAEKLLLQELEDIDL